MRRGAFSGAYARKQGLLELAGHGTLFLDEVHHLPRTLQPKLLRALESRRVRRVGGLEEFSIECRIIAAASPHLEQVVASGEFREDLYYRLNVFSIVLPPLRERLDDVQSTAHHFLRRKRAQDQHRKEFSPEAMTALLVHRWPGNVRELKNVIERAAILSADSPVVRPEHLMIQRRTTRERRAGDHAGGDSDSGDRKAAGGHRARSGGAHAQAHQAAIRRRPRAFSEFRGRRWPRRWAAPRSARRSDLGREPPLGPVSDLPPAVAALIERAQQSERSGRREIRSALLRERAVSAHARVTATSRRRFFAASREPTSTTANSTSRSIACPPRWHVAEAIGETLGRRPRLQPHGGCHLLRGNLDEAIALYAQGTRLRRAHRRGAASRR